MSSNILWKRTQRNSREASDGPDEKLDYKYICFSSRTRWSEVGYELSYFVDAPGHWVFLDKELPTLRLEDCIVMN